MPLLPHVTIATRPPIGFNICVGPLCSMRGLPPSKAESTWGGERHQARGRETAPIAPKHDVALSPLPAWLRSDRRLAVGPAGTGATVTSDTALASTHTFRFYVDYPACQTADRPSRPGATTNFGA
jgi:hypothetical protein